MKGLPVWFSRVTKELLRSTYRVTINIHLGLDCIRKPLHTEEDIKLETRIVIKGDSIGSVLWC